MRKSILLAVLTIALFSCKKEDVKGPVTGGVYKEYSVFPLKEGDIWRVDIVRYNYSWPDMSPAGELYRNFETYYDTIKAPQKRDDGKEYYSFFSEFYTLLDENTVQTSFNNIQAWTKNEYPGEYIYFADVKEIDTLSRIDFFYTDVGPEKGITIAYPEETTINGYKCKRTEILYYITGGAGDIFSGKRVVYFSKGNGPVYDAQYWLRNNPTHNINDPLDTVLYYEKYYKQVVFSKD
jgi:hypothetical protein